MARILAIALLGAALSFSSRTAAGATVLFGVDVTFDGTTAPTHVFGWRDTASDLVDAFDVAEPPPPPYARVGAAFNMVGPGAPVPNRWREDIRSEQCLVDGSEAWLLVVEPLLVAGECTLTFSAEPLAAATYTLRVSCTGVGGTIRADGQFTFPVTPGAETVIITVADSGVPVTRSAWGAVQALYR